VNIQVSVNMEDSCLSNSCTVVTTTLLLFPCKQLIPLCRQIRAKNFQFGVFFSSACCRVLVGRPNFIPGGRVNDLSRQLEMSLWRISNFNCFPPFRIRSTLHRQKCNFWQQMYKGVGRLSKVQVLHFRALCWLESRPGQALNIPS
jgi:hypothetical protein